MKILEVRDSFIKVESDKQLPQSSFLQINDLEKCYIAQAIQIKTVGEKYYIFAKLISLYNGSLYDYDNTLPSMDAEVDEFSFELISKTFDYKTPIITGKFLADGRNIPVDINAFDKNILVSFDTVEHNRTVITNFAKQFKNSIIIDTLGVFNESNFVAGVDFKLPLNSASLAFIYEDCLEDATSDSKNLIKEIFEELAEYSKTVEFLPFSTLKNIVDKMVEKDHVFKLLVLKNKLAKFDKLKIFASNTQEVQNIKNIVSLQNAIIDFSKLETKFQNRYLDLIYTEIEKLATKPQVFFEMSNSITKKSLKRIYASDISTVFVTNSKFKYIKEIKTLFENYIIEPSFTNIEAFKNHSMFLNQMKKDTYLFVGECSKNLPLISKIEEIENFTIEEIIENSLEQEEMIVSEDIQPEEEIQISEPTQEEFIIEEISDPSVIAINEKSELLIEKVSEELTNEETTTPIDLFNEDDSEEDNTTEEIVNIIETSEQTDINDEIELIESDLVEETPEISIKEIQGENEIQDDNFIENSENTDILSVEEISDESNFTEQPFDEFHTSVDEIQTIEISEEISELTESIENEPEEILIEENDGTIDSLEISEVAEESLPEENSSIILEETPEFVNEDLDVIPLTTDEDDFEEIIELDDADTSEADIIIDFNDENETELKEETLDREIMEDVDKVFTTIKDDEISDTDLDFIDELNSSEEETDLELSNNFEEIPELESIEENDDDSFLEPLEEVNDSAEKNTDDEKEILETRNSTTPIVPVYSADIPQEDLVASDPIEQGDSVFHAKYGNGVVEKMIKYGTKTLYSINFDNVGRKLLDPLLTEIKKS